MTSSLPELSLDKKLFTTAALLFLSLGILAALAYIYVSHRVSGGSGTITPKDIADTYYGPGVSVATLIDLAHIHILALFSLFWVVGFIFLHSTFSPLWKGFWSVLPFVAFPIDIAGWFATESSPAFVYIVIIGGGVFVLSLVAMIVLSLYDIWLHDWFRRRRMVTGGRQG